MFIDLVPAKFLYTHPGYGILYSHGLYMQMAYGILYVQGGKVMWNLVFGRSKERCARSSQVLLSLGGEKPLNSMKENHHMVTRLTG